MKRQKDISNRAAFCGKIMVRRVFHGDGMGWTRGVGAGLWPVRGLPFDPLEWRIANTNTQDSIAGAALASAFLSCSYLQIL